MSRKRPAEHQLTKDNFDEELESAQPEEIQKATPAELSKRKILRIKKPNQPTSTGGLFSGIAVGGLAASTANKPPGAAAPAPAAGGFGGFSFQPMAPISMKPVAAAKAEEPAPAAPAATAADPVQFNFAAPTSFGAKFDPPTTSDKVSFPPLTAGAKFDSLASAFQPPSSSPTSTPPVLTPFATTENEMAKLAAEAKDVASSPSASPTGDAASVGSPAGSSSKKPEVFTPANVRQEVAPVLDTKVEAASDKGDAEKPAVALQGVTLREAKEDKTGWTERGTGSVHLTERGADGSKPRLLMWREQTHQLILNAAIDDTFRLASQELKLKTAFAFVWFNPETNKPLTYSLKVKKSDSIELLFDGIKAAQTATQ